MKETFLRVLRMDLKRAFFSWKFVMSVILGGAVCFFTLLFCGSYRRDTLYEFVLLHDRSQVFLAYIAGILAYALCFYEDFSHGNIRNVAGRIRIPIYVLSKTIAALLSAICAFTLGKFLFIALYSINHPVCMADTLSAIPGSSRLYYNLLIEEHYFSFFFITSLQKALYCGILCQVVMIVSILIPNKAVVFSIPIAAFYVLTFYVNSMTGMSEYLNFTLIFDGHTRIWQEDGVSFGYSVMVALISYFILYRLTLWVVRKKVYHE